jgi:hypothetical protein
MNPLHLPHESHGYAVTPHQVNTRVARRQSARRTVWMATAGLGMAAVAGTGLVALSAAGVVDAAQADTGSSATTGSGETEDHGGSILGDLPGVRSEDDGATGSTTQANRAPAVQAPATSNRAPAAATHSS